MCVQAEKVAAFFDARTVKVSRKRALPDSSSQEALASPPDAQKDHAGKPADLATPAIISVEGRLHPVQVSWPISHPTPCSRSMYCGGLGTLLTGNATDCNLPLGQQAVSSWPL